MGKPYRFRTLIHLFIVLVMVCSGLLSVVTFSLLRGFRILPPAFFATIWMPIVIILVANVVAGIANIFLVPRVIHPIEILSDAMGRVAAGDFNVKIESENYDGEIEKLMESFNAMTKELGSTEIFRSDFIRDFSHEFKTPIVSMNGFAKQLKKKDLTDEERENYCDIIISESDRLTNMASNILLLSKVENQEIISDRKPYRLDEQLRDCVLLYEKEWEKKEILWDLELSEITLVHNADMLYHVWSNLISNAIKFSPQKGKISISATENGENIVVVVRDEGIGMSGEEMKHIFEKCYQADSSHKEKGNGLGLC
ncbi:MAG: HAMP domain-containing histidine kinase, partial [Clostridia bacterium]|nr:HAMP domain-containing histidine kinase [Clostridia bacterium]